MINLNHIINTSGDFIFICIAVLSIGILVGIIFCDFTLPKKRNKGDKHV